MLLLTGCAAKPTPPPPEPPIATEAPAPQPVPRVVVLEDGTYVEITPGVEPGFNHCCGNDDYIMEIDCSRGLKRCYKRAKGTWKQTFGRHCKSSLDQTCYLHACDNICEAHWVFKQSR